MLNLASIRNSFIAAALCLAVLSPSYADDTEIFFGQSEDAFETNPNIVFVLDVSGSMALRDGTGISRLNRMKNAMRLLLEQSSNYNVGVMAFNGRNGGASVRYPVADLDSDSNELCPDGVCPDETVFVRPQDPTDDASQNNQSLEVSLNDDFLVMGQVDQDTIDNVSGTTTGNNTFEDTSTGDLVTKTYIASSSVQENTADDSERYLWSNHQLENRWFFENENLQESLFGYQFTNIDIPRNARITSANITFTLAGGSGQSGEVSAFVSGEQTPDPEPFPTATTGEDSNNNTLDERLFIRRTNEVVSWDAIAGTTTNPSATNDTIVTPEMSDMLNELIRLPSWESGKTMSFIVSPLDNHINLPENIRTIYAAGAQESLRPLLTVTYEELEEEDLPTQTTTVQANQSVDEFIHQNTQSVWRNTTNPISNLFYVGPGNDPRNVALRFSSVNVPKGATVESVFLKLAVRGNEPESLGSDWQLVKGSGTDNPGAGDGVDPAPSASKVVVNIRAEQSVNPAGDTDTILSDRDPNATFLPWTTSELEGAENLRPGEHNFIQSPDLSSIVQEVISRSDWENSKSLSLILAPDGGYSNDPADVLRILNGNANRKPELVITFSVPEQTAANRTASHTTAVRFRNVHVPPGTAVTSAKMIFYASAPNGDEANLRILGESTANSQAFSDVNNDIGQRQSTNASATWNPEPWVAAGNEYRTADVTDIVNEIVEQNDWCAGNSLTMMISGSNRNDTDGNRFAESVESDAVNAPALEITYSPSNVPAGDYCSNTSLIVSAAQKTDDVSESIIDSQVLNLSDNYLSTDRSENGSTNNTLGLRFQGLQLPPGAIISNASLEFVAAADMPSEFSMNISVHDSANAQAYSSTNNQSGVSNRPYGDRVNWQGLSAIAGDSLSSSDITPLVKAIVDKADWRQGNDIAFRIESQSGVLDVVSNDGDESSVPRLTVDYQTLRSDPGTLHRSQIQRTVDSFRNVGGTPIVSSLYEAATYLRGEQVDYGTRRGVNNRLKRWFRVSHPGSYDGGRVSRSTSCRDNNLFSRACSSEQINHSPSPAVYKSPISSQCQSNHIVLLSDGEATSNTAVDEIEALIGNSCDTSVPENNRCGVELAKWLREGDHSSQFPQEQRIITHTIGFNLQDASFLEAIAGANPEAQYRDADSASELLGAFKEILNTVSSRNASFVAPGATVSQFNRLRNSNDVYYAMFKPSSTARWDGNLKRYEIGVTTEDEFGLFDSDGELAVDSDTGTFDPSSKSFWSTVTDGDNVEFGGAAEQLSLTFPTFSARNVYTFNSKEGETDLTHSDNRFDPDNSTLDTSKLSLPPAVVAIDPSIVDKVVAWGKGADVQDENGDQNTTQVRADMGDPMHSVPVVTNYADGESVIYMSTNEGFLHALDTDTGHEHFAFIPEELYHNIYRFYQNQATINRPYGLDGGKILWHDDTNKDGLIDKDETAILYVAMRRGGNSYFALDVSEYQSPKYLWSIKGGEIGVKNTNGTVAEGNWSELASTWSLPVKTKILDGKVERDVIIFGGGYDQNQDPTRDVIVNGNVQVSTDVRKIDGIGRAIFIADAKTGERIWSTDFTKPFDDMQYSIPSRVRVIDVNFDGIADQLYVGDMGGQLWRMDFNNDKGIETSIADRISAGIIASIAGDTPDSNRKFYYPPDVAVINLEGRQALTISIGSGWRAHPLDNIVKDRQYSFRSSFVFGAPINSFGRLDYGLPVTEENERLIDVTDEINADVGADSLGWFLRFDEPGEKPLASSLTFNNQLVFTTYAPSNAGFSCEAAIGNGFVYALNIYNGAPILNFDATDNGALNDSDRKRALSNPGLPPEVSVLFPEANPGSEVNPGSGLNSQPLFQVGKETISELDGGDVSQTTFWQEVSENHDE